MSGELVKDDRQLLHLLNVLPGYLKTGRIRPKGVETSWW